MKGGGGSISSEFVNLHVHSKYSLRDSIIKAEDLIARLQEVGQSAVAITDHGMTLGAVSFYKQLKAAGIKYIHGCEMYICDDVKIHEKESKNYHLLVLCKNETGRINLNRLITISNKEENKYRKPRVDLPTLSQYKDGLIILSACLAGKLSNLILIGRQREAMDVAAKFKRTFGDDYYIEIQSHTDANQIRVNKELCSIAKTLNIKTVVTTDAHYVWVQDKEYQNKYAFNGGYKEDGEAYMDCYIQSVDEVRQKLSYLPEEIVEASILETNVIADKCNVDLPLSAPIMPDVSVPPQYANSKEWLHDICRGGFKEKLGIDVDTKVSIDAAMPQELVDTYIDRYEYEMNALEKMGFVDYILLVYTYSNVGKRRGPARGSGGGSLVNYVSNITDIDPIRYGLYFERFIDVGALSKLESGEITAKELKIPDIDLDFSFDSCQDVMRFIYQKYGETHVAAIGKFGTNLTNGTIRDMCKASDIPLKTEDEIAKAFDGFEMEEIDQMIAGDIPTSQGAKDAIRYVKQYPELFRYVRKLIGLPKSFGLHACGKIISTHDLDFFLPSCYDDNGIRYLQGDMHDVEDLGLVKIDLLALRTLDQEFDTLQMSNETTGFISPRQDFCDEQTLDIFRRGDTVGIFQMSSPGMKKMLRQMKISGLDDIAVANALYRPGALAYIDTFTRRRNGDEQFEYLHPDLKPILESTYGIILYQEQLIEIGKMAGIHNPDILRKATGKKNIELLNSVRAELSDKLYARGWSVAQFEKLWSDMLDFARYSFNKSHAYAYGMISYMTAKQKAHYPVEFYAGLCNSYMGQSGFAKDNAAEIMADITQHHIKMVPFNFRNDHRRCHASDGCFVYGIPLIREMNQSIADALYAVRESKEKYFCDLVCVLNQKHMELFGKKATISNVEGLVRLGFFSEYGNVRELLLILDAVELFKFGNAKKITSTAEEIRPEWKSVLWENSTDQTKSGTTSKFRTIFNATHLLREIESHIKSLHMPDISVYETVEAQQQYLGFAPIATGREGDRKILYVNEVSPLKRKSDNKQFGYSVVATSLGSGKRTRYSVLNRVFRGSPVSEGDMIRLTGYSMERGYYNLTSYEMIAV